MINIFCCPPVFLLTKSITMFNIACLNILAFSLSTNNIAIFKKALKSNIASNVVLLLIIPMSIPAALNKLAASIKPFNLVPLIISYPFFSNSGRLADTHLSIVQISTSKNSATIFFVKYTLSSNQTP